ncbi:MAG: hypothetical protein Q4G51_10170 [Dermatophilus congolensis]|nr:hypothetical protein [Dermatophilus congolensis]
MAETERDSSGASTLFACAERLQATRLMVLCIRPDPAPELIEALAAPTVAHGLVLDDSPEHAAAVNALLTARAVAHVDTLCADLFATHSYEGRVPADVIVLGSRLIAREETPLRMLIEGLRKLCSRDGLVMWPLEALTPERRTLLQRLLDRAGFESIDPEPGATWQCARHLGVTGRLEGPRL